MAVTLVRHEQSLSQVKVKAVRKKMKERKVAAAVNRDEMLLGAEQLGVDFADHVVFVLEAMSGIAGSIGLNS